MPFMPPSPPPKPARSSVQAGFQELREIGQPKPLERLRDHRLVGNRKVSAGHLGPVGGEHPHPDGRGTRARSEIVSSTGGVSFTPPNVAPTMRSAS